jgi:hypothetical protein
LAENWACNRQKLVAAGGVVRPRVNRQQRRSMDRSVVVEDEEDVQLLVNSRPCDGICCEIWRVGRI